MTQLVCNEELFDQFIESGLLSELDTWWQANGLIWSDYWVNAPVTIETDLQGNRTLHYVASIHEAGGPTVKTVPRSTPLLVEPPAHWPQGAAPVNGRKAGKR
ncbi:hypothetical protein [Streptomyces sanglieri]|uniref:hypothetical protein n=1 Tax=Streptomyces sanglieri TaxID=193460 RepID=UPI003524C5BE